MGMRGHLDDDQQIARAPSIDSALTQSTQTNFFSGFDTRRDFDVDPLGLTVGPRQRHDVFATGNGGVERDGDLLLDILAASWSTWSSKRPRRACSHAEPAENFVQLGVAATCGPRLAENLLEVKRHSPRSSTRWKRASSAASASHLFEFGAELIVHFALLLVAQDVISVLHFLKFRLGPLLLSLVLVRHQIGMEFPSALAIRFLDLCLRSGPGDSQYLIVIFSHRCT